MRLNNVNFKILFFYTKANETEKLPEKLTETACDIINLFDSMEEFRGKK